MYLVILEKKKIVDYKKLNASQIWTLKKSLM